MAGRIKKKHRFNADVAHWFPGVGSISNYEQFVGLWLNIERIRLQHAIEVHRGIESALTDQFLPLAWFDALASIPEQAGRMKYAADRKKQTAMAIKQAMTGRMF